MFHDKTHTTVSLTEDAHAVRVNNATRQQAKPSLLLTNDHSVSRIVSALNTIPTCPTWHKTAAKISGNKIACVRVLDL